MQAFSSMFGERSFLNLFRDSQKTARFSKRQTYDTNLICYCSMPKCWDDMVQCEFVISDPSTVNNR